MAREQRVRTESGDFNEVGGRVRERTLALGLSDGQVAARIADQSDGRWNPDRQAIQMIVRKTRTVTTTELMLLAEVLECSACWLLIGDEKSA